MMGPCVAPGCRANYKGEKYIASFKFPSNKELRNKWIKMVPRKEWRCTKNSSLCIRHFQQTDIIDSVPFVDADGTLNSVPAGRMTLKEGSLPTIWPGVPLHLKIPAPKATILPEVVRLPEHKSKVVVLQKDVIESYVDFSAHCKSKLKFLLTKNNWRIASNSDSTVFYKLSIADTPSIRVSIKVGPDLSVAVFEGTVQIYDKDSSWIIPNGQLADWSQLEILINHYEKCNYSPDTELSCHPLVTF